MLSTRLSSSLNANATSSLMIGDQLIGSTYEEPFDRRPTTIPSHRLSRTTQSEIRPTTAGSASVCSFTLSPVTSLVSSPITVSSTFAVDEVEEQMQHLDIVSRLRSRRESARQKYQQFLVKRSNSNSSIGSSRSNVPKLLSKRPKRIQRDFSEIDERDEFNVGLSIDIQESESFRDTDDFSTSSSLAIRNTNSFRHYKEACVESGSTYQPKPKPHIKGYAEEYNTLVGNIVDFVSKRRERNDESNDATIRSGQLKKVATMVVGIGFDTFVELKLGTFRYYEDVGNGNVKIRTVQLDKFATKCGPMKHMESQPFAGWSRVFELIMKNSGRKIFWMTKSEEERDEWISDINNAMVTEGPPSQINFAENSAQEYNADIVLYLHTQGLIRGSATKEDYLAAMSLVAGNRLTIPVSWLKEYSGITRTASDLYESELWRQLLKNDLCINGQMVKADNYERAISALSSHIIDTDDCITNSFKSRRLIKESQAVLYARDILLACCHETRADDNNSLFCVRTLFGSKLAAVFPSPSRAEPLKITLRKIREGNGRYGGSRKLPYATSTDSLSSFQSENSDGHSLALSSCAEDSIVDSIAYNPNMSVEVKVQISNIYRICTKTQYFRRGNTWG